MDAEDIQPYIRTAACETQDSIAAREAGRMRSQNMWEMHFYLCTALGTTPVRNPAGGEEGRGIREQMSCELRWTGYLEGSLHVLRVSGNLE